MKNYGSNQYFSFQEKGAALTAAVTYPAKISRSDVACAKALEISTGSFIQRPSLSDTAVSTISSFINDGIYIYQEPDKKFLCSIAVCYALKGKARFIVSGNAAVYHFNNGQPVNSLNGRKLPMFGEKLHWKEKAGPESDISQGTNAFILCSADEDEALPDAFPETLFSPDMGAGEWTDATVSYFNGRKCTAAAIVLPSKNPHKFLCSIKGGSRG